jgi:iron(III) transport system permease protein
MATATIAAPRQPLSATHVRRVLARAGVLAFLAAVGYLVLVPMFRLQSLALEDNARGYRVAFERPGISETIRTTVALALGSLAIALVLGTLLAWAATRLPPRLRVLRVLPILPIVVPAVASVLGWSFMLSPRPGYLNALLRTLPWWDHLTEGPVDVYTLPWIVIITGFGLTAFVYLFVSAGFENINSELIEAAQVSGSSQLGIFFRVILPLLRPVLVYGGGVALLLGLGQFTGPLLLGRNAGVQVLTTEMFIAVSQNVDYGQAAALGSPLVLFGIAVVIFQKLVLGDQTRFVTHGGKSFRGGTKPSKGAAAAIIAYSCVATIVPVFALVVVALSPFWSSDINVSAFTLDNIRHVLEDQRIWAAITTSISASIYAVLIALPIGFIASTLLLKNRRYPIVRSSIDLIVALPLGIPAVIFGVAFLLTYTKEPFVLYGTKWVIVLVYVTLMLPFTTRMQLSGMVALGDQYTEASRVSGAGFLRTNTKVILPLMRGTLGGAAALMFVLLTHEFAASLLVRSPTTNTMGTILYDLYTSGSYPVVASIALVMTVVTAVGVLIAIILGGSQVFDKL